MINDVAQLKSHNNKLNEITWKPENMFGNLLEAVPEMIFTTDSKGNIIYANKAYMAYISYLYEDGKQVNIFDVVLPGNLKAIKQKITDVFKGNTISNLEFKSKTKHGSYVDVHISLSPVLDSDRKVIAAFGIGRDVTEQKQVMEKLRESEEMHRNIFDNSPDIMFTADAEGKMVSINKSWREIFQFGPDEIIGRLFTDFIREEALPQILEDYKRVISGEKVVSETIVIGKGGKEHQVQSIIVPLIKDGIITKIHGIVRDITDYKMAEDKLRLMFDSMTDGVIVTNLEGTIIELNERTAEIHGYDSKDKLLGRNALKLIPPVYRERVKENILKTLELGQIRDIAYRLLRKDGSEFWGELNASVMKDAFGKPTGLVGILRDISQRKKSEQMLQKSEDKFRSIIKALPDSIFHINRYGTIIDEPMGYNRMIGFHRSKLPGKKLHDIFPDDFADKGLKAIKKTLDSSVLQVFEYKWAFPPGNNSIYEIRVAPCGIDEVIAIVRDITSQKQYEERLLTYQQYLQSLTSQLSEAEEHERRRLAEGLHDLIGQPLAVIKMKLNTWKDILCSYGHTDDMKQVVELLESAVQNTRSLTFDLSPPVLYELGLEAGLEFLLEQFQERYGIVYEYKDDDQEKLLESKVGILLYRCAAELLMNVVKHSQAQHVKLSIYREDNQVLITINDDGVGFDISQIEVGSKRFGLFSIHERLNWVNGLFEIQSKPGSGTHATLKAPLIKTDTA